MVGIYKISNDELDKNIQINVVKWEGRLQCCYLNDFRIAGGKPWGGGATEKAWDTNLREVIKAFPVLQKALGFDYLGKRISYDKEPKIGDIKLSEDGKKMVYMPDPWSWNAAFPCWCSVEALEKDGILYPTCKENLQDRTIEDYSIVELISILEDRAINGYSNEEPPTDVIAEHIRAEISKIIGKS